MRLNNRHLQELAERFYKKHQASVEATKALVDLDSADEAQLKGVMDLYDPFIDDNHKYLVDDIFSYNGSLYKVLEGHITEKGLAPDDNLDTLYYKYEPKQ